MIFIQEKKIKNKSSKNKSKTIDTLHQNKKINCSGVFTYYIKVKKITI